MKTLQHRAIDLWNAIRNEDRPELVRYQMEMHIGAAIADERKACAQLTCMECATGDAPQYDNHLHAYYHGMALCEASPIYKRNHVPATAQETSPKSPNQGA